MKLLPAVFLLLLPLAAPAQLKINELYLDPPGTNIGTQIIELINDSNASFKATFSWRFCIRPFYPAVPRVTIPAHGVVQLHIGDSGENTATDWYMPTVALLPLNGEFAIYASSSFGSPSAMRDFVSWGDGANSTRIGTAVSAMLWPSVNDGIELPGEGSSLAWFGSGHGPEAYYADSTPTLGSPNEPASFDTFGTGCLAEAAIPEIGIVSGGLPWLGESFSLEFSSLPGSAVPFGILGDSDSVFAGAPLPLDLGMPLGFPGCSLWVSADFISPALANMGGTATWTFDIPGSLPSLVGMEFFFQSVVLFGVGEGAMSNAGKVVIGGPR